MSSSFLSKVPWNCFQVSRFSQHLKRTLTKSARKLPALTMTTLGPFLFESSSVVGSTLFAHSVSTLFLCPKGYRARK